MYQPHPAPGTAAQRPPWLTTPRAIALGLAIACVLAGLIYGLRETHANGIGCGSAWAPDRSAAQQAKGQAYYRAIAADHGQEPPGGYVPDHTDYAGDCASRTADHETPAVLLTIVGSALLLGSFIAPRRRFTY